MTRDIKNKLPIAVLGATGVVGQKVLSLLLHDPLFYVAEVAGSCKTTGQMYGSVVNEQEPQNLLQPYFGLPLKDPLEINAPYVISCLPVEAARVIELALAEKGHIISSNASAFRMRPDVPLLIPEVNQEALALVKQQPTLGKLITNPNCVVSILAPALKPLMSLGAVCHISIVTLQAISGAGYPGVPAMDIIGNIIPFIAGEEEKIQEECKKILTPFSREVFGITVHVHRIPILHGHTAVAHVHFAQPVDVTEVEHFYKDTALYAFHPSPAAPQPRKHLMEQDMRIHIGRLKQGDHPNILGLLVMGHNLVRGAAGAAIENLRAYCRMFEPR